MRNETRERFEAYRDGIAELNGVSDASKKFVAAPSVQQKLIDKQQESSDFLSRINIITVTEQKAEIIGLGVSGRLASRTNTAAGNRRQTKDPTGLDNRGYEVKQTNFDTHLTYAKLDAWAKFPDFEQRIQNHIVRLQALDRICIGFNGVSAAVATDQVANPNLEDVNIGWLQKLRLEAADQVIDEGDVAGKITYGDAAADYIDLDALIWDTWQGVMPTWARNRTDLVALCGNSLAHDKYFPLVNTEFAPTEQLARDIIMSTQKMGRLPAMQVPFFPDGTVLITPLNNLSIYEQEQGRRRHIKEEPELDRVADYQSANEAYVLEDLDPVVLIENIEQYA